MKNAQKTDGKKGLGAAGTVEPEKLLLEITSLPTAAGREDAVIAFVERWAGARGKRLVLSRDRHGNIKIARRDFPGAAPEPPLFITAHLDHPAFVVLSASKSGMARLEFRGGVQDPYFKGARIEIFDRAMRRSFPARITSLRPDTKPFKTVAVRLLRRTEGVGPGCIGRWKFPPPEVSGGLLRSHACDDLGGVAAALAAFDEISRDRRLAHVALLFTRAEEVGFVGAIGAARGGALPKGSRLICLECSRSFPHDSPIGAGPIVRVGDRLSVFPPELTNALADIAAGIRKDEPSFGFQRKLMPGGACEATAFSGYGITAACLCLPLGNYHNMRDIDGVAAGKRKASVGREYVSISDFKGLVRLLKASARELSRPRRGIKEQMEKLWAERRYVLGGELTGTARRKSP